MCPIGEHPAKSTDGCSGSALCSQQWGGMLSPPQELINAAAQAELISAGAASRCPSQQRTRSAHGDVAQRGMKLIGLCPHQHHKRFSHDRVMSGELTP